ncbi:unnamed protein product [Amaranthus hypochondriacus]
MDEIFAVSGIIDKLPPSWMDVRHALKLKKDDMSLTDLEQYVIIESSIRVYDGQTDPNPYASAVHMVEGNPLMVKSVTSLTRGTLAKQNPLKMGVGNAESQDI